MKSYLLFILLLVHQGLPAQETATERKKNFNLSKGGIAISGYDPVSYFDQSGPKKGDSKWDYYFNGINYWFSTEKNRAIFIANPSKYEPAYGGWCAYAIGTSGEKVDVDPLTFKIHKGKLLLFYNKSNTNTLTLWNENESRFYVNAEKNWPNVIKH